MRSFENIFILAEKGSRIPITRKKIGNMFYFLRKHKTEFFKISLAFYKKLFNCVLHTLVYLLKWFCAWDRESVVHEAVM